MVKICQRCRAIDLEKPQDLDVQKVIVIDGHYECANCDQILSFCMDVDICYICNYAKVFDGNNEGTFSYISNPCKSCMTPIFCAFPLGEIRAEIDYKKPATEDQPIKNKDEVLGHRTMARGLHIILSPINIEN